MPEAAQDSIALHSGAYVERYNSKPLDRVAGLAARMEIAEHDELADFACGNAMLLQVIGERAGVYHGVDFSPDFIAAAAAAADRLGIRNRHLHCCDIVAFCRRNPGRFDVAAALDFSEHVDDDTFIEIFTAIREAMKPGARLYLHTPNRRFVLEVLKEKGILRQFAEHIAVRDVDQLTDLLARCGFARGGIRAELIPHYNAMKLLHPLRVLPWIGRWFEARIWMDARA